MTLGYAVDKLYEAAWTPRAGDELEQLEDGRVFPSVLTVQRAFAEAGLELAIKHNLIFKCYRASWAPAGEIAEAMSAPDGQHGAVVGACEREAAIYALSQLHATRAERQMAMV